VSDSQYQISIQVLSRHLPEQSDPDRGVFSFAYTVRITNSGQVAAQLVSRHWIIRDGRGEVVEVKGLGVVGRQPLIEPGQTYEYTSGSQLATPVGTMTGSYFFVAEDNHRFDAPIPEFALTVPRALH
jgi:ApaG protein